MEWGVFIDCWRTDRRDALAWLLTALGVILLGFNEGIVAGLLLSMVFAFASFGLADFWLVLRGRWPFDVEQVGDSESVQCLRVCLKGPLLFANAETLAEALLRRLQSFAAHHQQIKIDVMLDLSGLSDLDTTAIQAMTEFHQSLLAQGFVVRYMLPNDVLLARLKQEGRLIALVEAR